MQTHVVCCKGDSLILQQVGVYVEWKDVSWYVSSSVGVKWGLSMSYLRAHGRRTTQRWKIINCLFMSERGDACWVTAADSSTNLEKYMRSADLECDKIYVCIFLFAFIYLYCIFTLISLSVRTHASCSYIVLYICLLTNATTVMTKLFFFLQCMLLCKLYIMVVYFLYFLLRHLF